MGDGGRKDCGGGLGGEDEGGGGLVGEVGVGVGDRLGS